ncbi:MAG: hypothetical protein J5486_03765, partial [Bacteroidaceae bacterium]|nr:hypothetical protein [Bacteroidaceae bacterium]
SPVEASTLQYWFDENTANMEIVNALSGIYSLDVSALDEGIHTLHYQVVGTNGNNYGISSSVFIKLASITIKPTIGEVHVADKLKYWFDQNISDAVLTNVENDIKTIDVSALSNGMHSLHYQVVYEDNNVGPVATGIFLKELEVFGQAMPNSITRYQYWLNSNWQCMQTVKLNDASNPYSLTALLPMQSEPIRSESFHFDITDDQPTIYAKNDFHIRFTDAQGYFKDGEKAFVDYSVSSKVEPVDELLPSQTFPRVGNNDIRWYTVNAEAGDTVAFKVSQPATMQLFSPSGKEVYSVSESASTKYSGIHTWETGTYYLAVHDVTGTRPNMTLDYMHMDKYAVVDQDVRTVGNGGCSTITFKGNGFRDLYAVDLVVAPGDTIHSVDVGHDSDAETAVTFDFSDANLGQYNAVFHFTEEDKSYTKLMTVEEAQDIILTTDVSYPSTFLSGTSTTYTVRITNLGNMTAYAVPVYTWIKTDSKDAIKHIEFEGIELPGIYSLLDLDTLSYAEVQKLKNLEVALGAEPYFLKSIIANDDNINESSCIRTNYSCVNIPPNSTTSFKLVISSSNVVDTWFTIPDTWIVFSSEQYNNHQRMHLLNKKSLIEDYYCCYKEHIECFLENVSTACDIVSPVLAIAAPWLARVRPDIGLGAQIASLEVALIGCLTSITNDGLKTFGTTLCESDSEDGMRRLKDALRAANSTSFSVGSVLSCVGAVLSGIGLPKHILSDCLSAVGNSLAGAALGNDFTNDDTSCKKSREKKPNCPPCTTCGGGGSSKPQPPSDPNDIYGYLSEVGSKFIADTVAKVNYTIEFENDTAFAEAAAHTIVIKDTLDSRYFDLNTFVPTSVRVGEQSLYVDDKDVTTKNGVQSFVKTIDMRPAINAIAQVEGWFDQKTGIAQWLLTSLDPMTMEPTNDLMQGILPVNYNGTSGIGEVMFEIGTKWGKADGTEVRNRASITFDYEAPILTPTWTNIVDAIAPTSTVTDVTMENDTIARMHVTAEDNRSGVWYYDVYAQYGDGAMWVKVGEKVTTPYFDFRVYEDIDYGFCVIATDSAGNVEKKPMVREWPADPDITTGVGRPTTEVDDASPIYDLQGRPVTGTQNGIYIQRGRKRVVRNSE